MKQQWECDKIQGTIVKCAGNYCGTERRAREPKGSRLMLIRRRSDTGGNQGGLMPELGKLRSSITSTASVLLLEAHYEITPVERAETSWRQCILSPRAGSEWLRPALATPCSSRSGVIFDLVSTQQASIQRISRITDLSLQDG